MKGKPVFSQASVLYLSFACLLAACAGPAGAAPASDQPGTGAPPRLAGQWVLNTGQSDVGSDKIREAEQNARRARRGAGGGGPRGGVYPGGGIGMGRGGIGVGGGMGRGGMGRGGMGRGPGARGGGAVIEGADRQALAADPKTLTIGQNQEQLSISDDAGNSETLYADGKKHKEQDSGGKTITVKTHWDGARVVSERKLAHAGKLTQSFELSPDGKQLIYTSTLANTKLSGPLTIRRVYDNSATKPQ